MKTSTSLFAKLLGRAKCRAHCAARISLCVFKGQNGSMLTDTGMNIRRTFNPEQTQWKFILSTGKTHKSFL